MDELLRQQDPVSGKTAKTPQISQQYGIERFNFYPKLSSSPFQDENISNIQIQIFIEHRLNFISLNKQ